MKRWNALESSALSYSFGGIGFKVLFCRVDLFCLFFRFLARLFRFLASESELSDVDSSSLVGELPSDDELVESDDDDSDELEELVDDD